MSNIRRRILLNALKMFDMAVMVIAFALATVPSQGVGRTISVADFFSMRVKLGNFIIFICLLVLWHALFGALGLYASHRMASRISEAWDVIKATTLVTLLLWSTATVFHIRMASRPFVFTFFLMSTITLIMSRLLLRMFLVQTRLRGRNLRNVLIVGTSPRAVEFAEKIQSSQELGYRVMGFADRDWYGLEEFRQTGHQLACDLEGLPEFLRTNVVDEVVIALPMRSYHDDASRVAALCEQQGILLRVLSNIFNLKLAHSRAEEMEGDAFITHYTGAIEGWPVVMKRALDFTLALIALIIVSPVMLLAAALIKLT
jgi:FlaA1/EpsC-like NDP-sugar epimerase